MKPKQPSRGRLPDQAWSELKAAFLAGAELRPLARAADIPEGSVLSRASREQWAEERDRARQRAKAATPKPDISEAIAEEREVRAKRHVERMERVTERVGTCVEDLSGEEALDRIAKIATYDRVARRTLGMDDTGKALQSPLINVAVLAMGGPPLVFETATGLPAH